MYYTLNMVLCPLSGNTGAYIYHTCQPCNTAFLDHPPKFSLIFCDFLGSRKNARFSPFNRFWAYVQSIVVALTTPPPALELISHDLRPLPRPDLTVLQRCTTKNPRTTRHSGMKCMGCDQCQNSLCQKTVHTSHIPVYSLKLGVCVLTCWKQVVCIAEMGGMCYGNGGYVSVAEMGVCVVEMGGMCCGNVGYVSVAEMGGMCCRNGGYVLWKCGVCISSRNGGMCCRNGGYVLWKCGVCISCRNGRYVL